MEGGIERISSFQGNFRILLVDSLSLFSSFPHHRRNVEGNIILCIIIKSNRRFFGGLKKKKKRIIIKIDQNRIFLEKRENRPFRG